MVTEGTSAERKAIIETLIAEIRIQGDEIIPMFKIPAPADDPAEHEEETSENTANPRFAQCLTRWS